jgi:hypothetical protein
VQQIFANHELSSFLLKESALTLYLMFVAEQVPQYVRLWVLHVLYFNFIDDRSTFLEGMWYLVLEITSGIMETKTFHQKLGFQLKEETSEVIHLKHGFVWC